MSEKIIVNIPWWRRGGFRKFLIYQDIFNNHVEVRFIEASKRLFNSVFVITVKSKRYDNDGESLLAMKQALKKDIPKEFPLSFKVIYCEW